jgi:hypothetical protein
VAKVGEEGVVDREIAVVIDCKGCGSGEPAAVAMMKEQARLNAEARAVESLLATACPAAISGTKADPFTTAGPAWLMPRTLFAGRDTAIVILVNRDHKSDRLGTIYQSIEKGAITFQPPSWMKPTHAIRISPKGVESIQLVAEGSTLKANVQGIDLAEMLILTSDPNLEARIRQRWEQNLPRLQAVVGNG